MHIRNLVLPLLMLLGTIRAEAQGGVVTLDSITKRPVIHTISKPKGQKPIKKEISFGFRLNTDGWSVFSDVGKIKAPNARQSDMFYNVRFWQFELSEKKDPSQYKVTSDNGGGTNTYIYGKINNFYVLKLGWGYRKMIAGKPDPGSVSIHWVNAGGLAVGFLKPYYINTLTDPGAIKYTDATKEDFLNQSVIVGSAGFSKGLSETKIVPGGYFKSALHFDFSTNRKTVIAVETGFDLEYYAQQVQLMADQSPASYFADLYIAVQLGKRW